MRGVDHRQPLDYAPGQGKSCRLRGRLNTAHPPPLALIAVCAVAALGALFAATDAALTGLPEARLRAMIEAHPERVPGLRRYSTEPEAVLARLLTARVLCIVGSAMLAAVYAAAALPAHGTVIAFASVSLLYVTLAELATSWVRRQPEMFAETLLFWVRPAELVVLPIAAPMAALGRWVGARAPRRRSEDPIASQRIAEAEVEYLIEKGSATGDLAHSELLQAAVDFRGTRAGECMIPRTRMAALELRTPLTRVLEVVTAEGHSRYPIYDGRLDEIVGLLYVKDLFRVVRDGALEQRTLSSLLRKPVLFVQEQQEVAEVLKEMRHRRLHMAIVSDEYGGTAGLVTLEDVLELLVGEIRDELDDEDPIQVLGEGRLLVDAALAVDELADRLGVTIARSDGFVSLGGLVMEQLGKVPEAGTTINVGPVDLVVREADERRVRRIEVVARALDGASG